MHIFTHCVCWCKNLHAGDNKRTVDSSVVPLTHLGNDILIIRPDSMLSPQVLTVTMVIVATLSN